MDLAPADSLCVQRHVRAQNHAHPQQGGASAAKAQRGGKGELRDGSLLFLQRLRHGGVVTGSDWTTVNAWIHEARALHETLDRGVSRHAGGRLSLNLDADPRNADWLKIVRVRRLTGYEIPGWAALWLWRLAQDRDASFWSRVGRTAMNARLKRLVMPAAPNGERREAESSSS